MRLQRALARAGIASRRRSEELIRAGKIRVNGEVATIGAVVDPIQDAITIGDQPVREVADATIILHKPTGYVVSRRDPQGRDTVFTLIPEIPGLTYAGRLDVMTSGVLIFTTDGELANRLTHPRYEVPRTYHARVHGRPTHEIRRALRNPIVVDGRPVAIIRGTVRSRERGKSQIAVTLIEGRNRIVRRMCEQLGLVVERLVRIGHGPIELGNLREGAWRYPSEEEQTHLLEIGTPR